MLTSAFIGVLIPFAGTTIGSACVFFMKKSLHPGVQRALTGFAAGVMVAASIWSLLSPAMEQSAALGQLAFLPAVIGFWLGVGFLLLLDVLVPHLHQGADTPEGPKSGFSRTTMLVLAVTLHNIPEGLAVAVPFAYATRSRAAGVLAALVSGLAEPLGAVLAWLFLRRFFTPGFLTGTVVLTAGIMVWVALAQLLPQAMAAKHRAAGIFGAAAGTLLMLLGIAALP